MNKRGVSPVIATVLLIGIVIIIALIISVWLFGFLGETVVKNGRAVELSCDDVDFNADIFEGNLNIANTAQVPIYGFIVKKFGQGEILASEVTGDTIRSGETHSINLVGDHNIFPNPGDDFLVVPVLLGETQSSDRVAFTCHDETGKKVTAI